MGVDVQHPHGEGERTLLGHRLLCILRAGSKSMRDLHAATGRKVPAGELRAALSELRSSGLIKRTIEASGRRGGRPRETWMLLYPASTAISVAQQEIEWDCMG